MTKNLGFGALCALKRIEEVRKGHSDRLGVHAKNNPEDEPSRQQFRRYIMKKAKRDAKNSVVKV
jgi:hypothetical protein